MNIGVHVFFWTKLTWFSDSLFHRDVLAWHYPREYIMSVTGIILHFPAAILKYINKKMKLISIICYLMQYIYYLASKTYKIINEIIYMILKIIYLKSWCINISYAYSTSEVGLVPFSVLSNRRWLVATKWNSTILKQNYLDSEWYTSPNRS